VETVIRAVSEGANFQQVHRRGVRLVTMQKEYNRMVGGIEGVNL